MSLTLEQLILKMYDVRGLKFGDFVVRTGESSPVYIDMRVIWSYPDIVRGVCEHIHELIKKKDCQCDAVCGLPYQGIPIATFLCVNRDIPMLLKRKKPKSYGTCQLFEGAWSAGDRVAIVDDVLMTGATLVDDVPAFADAGLEVTSAFCFFDREQGGPERVKAVHGLTVHCVVTLSQAFSILLKAGKVNEATRDRTMAYIRDNRFDGVEQLKADRTKLKARVSNGVQAQQES